MSIYVFQTRIDSLTQTQSLGRLLDSNPNISRWCIDLDDIDRVLKIVALENLEEQELIKTIQRAGYFCATLPIG